MAAQGTTANLAPRSEQDSVPPPRHQPDLWGIIVTEKGGRHDVRMQDDTGTPVNWIHPDLARRFKLKVEKCDRQRFEDFKGKTFKAEQAVWFTWIGRQKDKDCTFYGEFYIAPERSSIDVVLGEEFVHANGLARDVCHLQRRTRPSHIFALEKKTKADKAVIDANKEKNDREARAAAKARESKKKQNKQEVNEKVG